MALEIVQVPVLSDNYAWLLHDADSDTTVVIDPGDANPLIAAAEARGWTVTQVWNTHWHPDHVAGNATFGVPVTAPAEEAAKIGKVDRGVVEGDTIAIGAHRAQVMRVPGHTQGHVAFHFAEDRVIFTGDTLFAMGCGRLFEGTPTDMYANMQRYAELPDDTTVYCGHEYTQSNGRFAVHVEPDNRAVAERLREVDALRARGEPTVPTTIGRERETNPFFRANSAEQLGERRVLKDSFKG
ncbi:hydroxyacylglutathione hydrolase [Sphingomonas sp.]|jgi:hydroxyacylglutathione hydrolase|uniref:hydroxyacylglutathione hydrolase n=1 Tax=Sphingomonas sp. TaxID=28214 RepID=UPI002D7EC97B|nr:hydroxyacylglutathione hydrolase [Sphingomonas sp.]HEU0043694.1 hydroxyacylglutathione hydrolase [Sphingomonas sp.]